LLRGWKDFFTPNISNPQLITFRIFMEARGGPVGDIFISDYIPPGEIGGINVTYVNSTGSYNLVNGTDYLVVNHSMATLPDGSQISVYLYNFSYSTTPNWSTYLGDGENITILYNVTVLGGGSWILPTILSGFDPTYMKYIKTEMFTHAFVPMFDVTLDMITNYVKPGEVVRALLKMVNVAGPKARVDVAVTYSAKTMGGGLIREGTETVAVAGEKERELELLLPRDIKPGSYTFESLVTYTGREAIATKNFEVLGEERPALSVEWILLAVIIVMAIILIAVWRTRR